MTTVFPGLRQPYTAHSIPLPALSGRFSPTRFINRGTIALLPSLGGAVDKRYSLGPKGNRARRPRALCLVESQPPASEAEVAIKTKEILVDLRRISQYDIVKNTLVGGAIGFCASYFIPFMRPVKGMLLGALVLAAVGVYKNLSNRSSAVSQAGSEPSLGSDVAGELQKFHSLRKSGAITEEEFQAKKAQLLKL